MFSDVLMNLPNETIVCKYLEFWQQINVVKSNISLLICFGSNNNLINYVHKNRVFTLNDL